MTTTHVSWVWCVTRQRVKGRGEGGSGAALLWTLLSTKVSTAL